MPTIRYCHLTAGFDPTVMQNRTTTISAWSNATTYALDAYANDGTPAPNLKLYKSLQANNLNHALSETDWWVLVADGSSTKPYQTATAASAGLTGGDEWRLAASPASTLVGNGTWTDGSTTVVVNANLTGIVLVNDFIHKNAQAIPGNREAPWHVAGITYGPTSTITLSRSYRGTTEIVPTYLLGISKVTTPSTSSQINSLSSNGTAVLPITGSGGWDLATETRSGVTWIAPGTFRNGYGLYDSGASYNNVSHIGVAGTRYGLFIGAYCVLSNCTAAGVNYTQFQIGGNRTRIVDCIAAGSYSTIYNSFTYYSSYSWCSFQGCQTISPGGTSFLVMGYSNTISDCKVYSDPSSSNHRAIYLYNTMNCRLSRIQVRGCSDIMYLRQGGRGNILSRLELIASPEVGSPTGNFVVVLDTATMGYDELPVLQCGKYRVDTGELMIFDFGSAENDATAYRGTSGSCWKFTPTDTTYYISSAGALKQWQTGGSDVTLYVWAKTDGTYNGTVTLSAWFEGTEIVAPVTQSLTSSYTRLSLTIPAASLPRAGFVELRVRGCKGASSGSFYLDDFGSAT